MRKRAGEARDNRHSRPRGEREARPRGEGDLFEILANKEKPLLLILDCVQDPNNLGAILRTADGAGVDAVIAPKDKAVGLTDTVRRVAVGAAESVPFIKVTNLARTMRELKDRGIWLVGTSDQATESLYDTDLKGAIAIVMGREGEGMRQGCRRHSRCSCFCPYCTSRCTSCVASSPGAFRFTFYCLGEV